MAQNSERTIEANAVYQCEEFKLRMGLRNAAWRSMVRQGLPVIRIGRRGYVNGADAIKFLSSLKTSPTTRTCKIGD